MQLRSSTNEYNVETETVEEICFPIRNKSQVEIGKVLMKINLQSAPRVVQLNALPMSQEEMDALPDACAMRFAETLRAFLYMCRKYYGQSRLVNTFVSSLSDKN